MKFSLGLVCVELIFVPLRHCISQSSAKKQNGTNRIQVYEYIYYKELVHTNKEAEKSQALLAGDPGESEKQETRWCKFQLQSEGRRRPCPSSKTVRQRMHSFLLSLLSIQVSMDWKGPTHWAGPAALLSPSIQMLTSHCFPRHTQNNV